MRGPLDPRDVNCIQDCLPTPVQEVRARSDQVLFLGVGNVCEEAGLDSAAKHMACCNVLDSERFARNHVLWYHYRGGSWGTDAAQYIFQQDSGSQEAPTDGPLAWQRRLVLALLRVAVIAVPVEGTAWAEVWLWRQRS